MKHDRKNARKHEARQKHSVIPLDAEPTGNQREPTWNPGGKHEGSKGPCLPAWFCERSCHEAWLMFPWSVSAFMVLRTHSNSINTWSMTGRMPRSMTLDKSKTQSINQGMEREVADIWHEELHEAWHQAWHKLLHDTWNMIHVSLVRVCLQPTKETNKRNQRGMPTT